MPAAPYQARTLHFIIVCAGGDHADLQALLDSIASQCAEIINWVIQIKVIENTDPPHDARLAEICAAEPKITLLRPSTNTGYGAGINYGVSAGNTTQQTSDSSWIIVCNADLVFPNGSLAQLTAALEANENQPVGLLAPRLLDPPPTANPTTTTNATTTQPSVGRFPSLRTILTGKLKPRRTRKYLATPTTTSPIDWATGACLAVRSSAFNTINGFDEQFFLDYEDVDLCKRLADAGYLRTFEPRWEVIHRHPLAQRESPNPQRLQHTRASLVRYFAKHRPRWEFRCLGLCLRLARTFRRSTHPMQPAWQAGYEAYRQLKNNRPRRQT